MHRLALLSRRLAAPVVTVTGGGILWSSCMHTNTNTNDEEQNHSAAFVPVHVPVLRTPTTSSTVVKPLLLHHVLLGALSTAASSITSITTTTTTTTVCEDATSVIDDDWSEVSRYERCLVYHRSMLKDYRLRWEYNNPTSRTPTTSGWPHKVPSSPQEVSMLEYDYQFATGKYRDDLQFRLAAYYLQTQEKEIASKAFPLLQELAIRGDHLDAMCLFGTVWMEGIAGSITANPAKACVWFDRAAAGGHRQACYEMGVALYTGEGVVENESLAVEFFEKAASMGHAAAAYMLGDCLLDGVGVTLRDRAEALEWLVAAGEMGHRGARSRVLAVLEQPHMTSQQQEQHNGNRFTDASRQTFRRRRSSIKDQVEEEEKWTEEDLKRLVALERQFTIGGGSRNPVVLEKRRTVVAESREDEDMAAAAAATINNEEESEKQA